MSRPPGLPKTGGRARGTPNKPKQIGMLTKPRPIKLAGTQQDRELIAIAQVMRSPKAVMLDAMVKFETLGKGLLAKADNLMKMRGDPKKAAELAQEGYKYIVAAVECATKVAPYIHARLLAVESRGDMTQDRAPYVLRAPMVMKDSAEWQAAVGAAVIEREAIHVANGGQLTALPERAIRASNADLRTGGQLCGVGGGSGVWPDQRGDVGETEHPETECDARVAGKRRRRSAASERKRPHFERLNGNACGSGAGASNRS